MKFKLSQKKWFFVIISLMAATSAALAYVGSNQETPIAAAQRNLSSAQQSNTHLTIKTDLVQDKIMMGSDGKVALAVDLIAAELPVEKEQPFQAVDIVIVLDRSGSMGGQKINDARQAVVQLFDRFCAKDRLALVTYSNDVQTISPLVPADDVHRQQLTAAVRGIYAGGGTNLGSGLQRGIEILRQTPAQGRMRKVVLISDGQANQGITAPADLGHMASAALEHHLAISTVGVGLDFNEMLMTTIADHGTGRYHFMEDPQSFAQVFEQEFQQTRNIVATGLEIRVPLSPGIRLVDAGGYPIQTRENYAIIHPGNLLSGQQRKLFLTFQVPAHTAQTFSFGELQVAYQHKDSRFTLGSGKQLSLACVEDQKEVIASINKTAWVDQVLQEDFNQLKEDVADAIRKGEKGQALKFIQEYETHNRTINATVGAAEVTQNIDTQVKALQETVNDTFMGAPEAVAAKQKQRAKSIQYEGYKGRRSKQ